MSHSYLVASSEADQAVAALTSKGYTVQVDQTGEDHRLTVDGSPSVALEELLLNAAPSARGAVD